MTASRILDRLESAERSEPGIHFRTDYRIAWLTVRWASQGIAEPFIAATYRILATHPELVWNKIQQERQAKLGAFLPLFYDGNGNLLPFVYVGLGRKPVRSVSAAEVARIRIRPA